MSRRKNGEIPLPEGWEEGQDIDGKYFYINHITQQTTWIDPRDRFTKPQSFSDCVGDELPYGWEEIYDQQVGVYYVDHIHQRNQLEDPRQQWRSEQEAMLKDYLVTAKDDLEAKKEICTVKEQRLQLAQEEFQHLHDTLTGWKSSRTSLNSNSSVGSTKYDPDLLKADVSDARKRVERLKHELAQIRTEMQYKQRGLDTLTMVDRKLSQPGTGYSVEEARLIMGEMKAIQKSLVSGERERLELMQSLALLKEDFTYGKVGGSSPDVSMLCIPLEKSTTASQTDLRGEFGVNSSRYLAEMTRLRLQYDAARQRLSSLKHMLADLEDGMVPGQNESDKDRLLLVQEKEQLLRELRGIDAKGRSAAEIEQTNEKIRQLGLDLSHAKDVSNKQIAERLKRQEKKTEILKELTETTKRTTMLESQLKSMSQSTLSISSGSSLGSLGSLSASSLGSLSSLGMEFNMYGSTGSNLQNLHRRVETQLQHNSSVSPIQESAVCVSPDVMAAATGNYLESVLGTSNQDLSSMAGLGHMHGHGMSAYGNGTNFGQYMPTLSYSTAVPNTGGNGTNFGQYAPSLSYSTAVPNTGGNMLNYVGNVPMMGNLMSTYSSTVPVVSYQHSSLQEHYTATSGGVTFASSHSSLSSMSPPVSPYDVGPPPTYGQHMNIGGPNLNKPPPPYVPQGRSAPTPSPPTSHPYSIANSFPHSVPQVSSSSQSKVVLDQHLSTVHSQSKSDLPSSGAYTQFGGYNPPLYQSGDVNSDSFYMNMNSNLAKRLQYPDSHDMGSNPPLSPISESSSGVCNNLSGGNTRSVSAAVSDESVAGDSGVFDAVVKKDMLDEVLEAGLESAQIQIKLKFESGESRLVIGLEQARNLTALQFPENSTVCIKAALLPSAENTWMTEPSTDLKNPRFSAVFSTKIPSKSLLTKTLQVMIWCLQDGRPDECFGCASVSLADFDLKDVISVRWYNVLSFKFMQNDSRSGATKRPPLEVTSRQVKESMTVTYNQTESVSHSQTVSMTGPSDKVTELLEASSVRLRRVQSTSDKRDSGYCAHPLVSTLKEESSDESTVMSSQTSTLTRNQGPEDMEGPVGDDTLPLGLLPPHMAADDEEEEGDLEEEDDYYEGLDPVAEVIQGLERALDGLGGSEGSTDREDQSRHETCDKTTNTVNVHVENAPSSTSASEGRNSNIRRSQTFSPGGHYVCKLNRSDSDSSMPLYKRGPFQRNSVQRRSHRWKRNPSSLGVRGGKVVTRTSLDMELDLQAYQTRLSNLQDENTRLRELKKQIEEAKGRGETEFPTWLSDDEHFLSLLSEADKVRQRGEHGQMTALERRAEQMMKRVTRDVHRLKRNHPNALTKSFREKLAYITTVQMQVPVIPCDNNPSQQELATKGEELRLQEILKGDQREGHEV